MWHSSCIMIVFYRLDFPRLSFQDGEDWQGDKAVGGLLLQRESQAAEEVGVAALRPTHGCSRRGVRPDQTGQPPRRGGVSHHEEISQHPNYHTVTESALVWSRSWSHWWCRSYRNNICVIEFRTLPSRLKWISNYNIHWTVRRHICVSETGIALIKPRLWQDENYPSGFCADRNGAIFIVPEKTHINITDLH